MDSRFVYAEPPAWQRASKQDLFGSDVIIVEPTVPLDASSPKQVDFEMSSLRPVLMGNMTGFLVEGLFLHRATAAAPWTVIPAADKDKVIVAPNWWGLLVKSIDIFHDNYLVKVHDEAQSIPQHLDTFLDAMMDPLLRKTLCQEDCHPGNAVPSKQNGWDFESTDWTTYADTVFGKATGFNFKINPLHLPLFYQSPNYLCDTQAGPPKAVPLHMLGKLNIRFSFVDDFSSIFRKKAGNTAEYKFQLKSFNLVLEEGRLNPALEKQLYSTRKNKLHYPGVAKIMRPETIAGGLFFHHTRFAKCKFPEGIFIFALPKKVGAGNWKYSETTAAGPLFLQHNINSVVVTFDNQSMAIKEPNFQQIESRHMEHLAFMSYFLNPPFGMMFNEKFVTRKNIANCFAKTDFPHAYLNLSPSGQHTRLIPLLNDGSIMNKEADLELDLKFGSLEGATADANYIIYLFYSDTNLALDLHTRKFSSPYDIL